MLAGLDLQQIEEITHGGVTLLLMVGLIFVWRAWQAERTANSSYQREFLTHVAELNQIPEALDRLRNEVLQELRDLRRH
jgi:tRNA threonylcarbamoyladenosine modification (KEOPS) complex Cgi121 subunit